MKVELRRGESPRAHSVLIGRLTLVFSYETCVAFAVSGEGWTACENVWSRTTGKHLNQEVPRGVERIPKDEFKKRLVEAMERVRFE